MTRLNRLCYPAFLLLLVVILAIGVAQLANPQVPALPAGGLMLTAAAPLLFLLKARFAPPAERRHPVAISATMGLGIAATMIGVQRYGDQHQWLLVLSLLALVAWMLYQRYVWRATPDRPREP